MTDSWQTARATASKGEPGNRMNHCGLHFSMAASTEPGPSLWHDEGPADPNTSGIPLTGATTVEIKDKDKGKLVLCDSSTVSHGDGASGARLCVSRLVPAGNNDTATVHGHTLKAEFMRTKPLSVPGSSTVREACETLDDSDTAHLGVSSPKSEAAQTDAQSLPGKIGHHSGLDPGLCAGKMLDSPFQVSDALSEHAQNCDAKRQFVCKECNATLSGFRQLRRHLRKHTTPRPYVCEECEATFTRSSSLSVHMQTHREETVCVQRLWSHLQHEHPFKPTL